MSATIARQGGRVQLEQSDMRLPMNVAKMAKGGFWHAAIKEMHDVIEKPHAEVRQETMRGFEIHGHQKVTAATERQPAPPWPEMPPAPPGDSERDQCTEIEVAAPGYVNIHAPLPNAEFFNLDAYAKDHKHEKDFIPDLLTNHGPSTGQYVISGMVM